MGLGDLPLGMATPQPARAPLRDPLFTAAAGVARASSASPAPSPRGRSPGSGSRFSPYHAPTLASAGEEELFGTGPTQIDASQGSAASAAAGLTPGSPAPPVPTPP